jgi:hypothetical protein
MTIPIEYANRFLYHITHIDNLSDIIEKGLLSTNEIRRHGISHKNIAYGDIQNRISTMIVPCGNGGILHDYVPLYFCKRSPMLYAVINTQGISDQSIIYLEFSINVLEQYPSMFTDSSANSSIPPNFYPNSSNLVKLHWNLIDTWCWGHQYDTEIDVSQIKQAEALIYRILPLHSLKRIVVRDNKCKVIVENIVRECRANIPNIVIGGRDYYFTE